jgi:hypothetical protein
MHWLTKFFSVRTLFLLVLAGLFLTAEEGPDQDKYVRWGQAALSGDIERLPGEQRSPLGLPFFQWSAGPGLLLAPFLAGLPMSASRFAAFLAGYVCVSVFWTCLYLSLQRLSNDALAVWGTAIAFVAAVC